MAFSRTSTFFKLTKGKSKKTTMAQLVDVIFILYGFNDTFYTFDTFQDDVCL